MPAALLSAGPLHSQLLCMAVLIFPSHSADMFPYCLSVILQLGAVTYACRIPERWYPGKFDIMGHSHQLWHAAVVLAAWVHYLAIMILLQWRDAAGEDMPGVDAHDMHRCT